MTGKKLPSVLVSNAMRVLLMDGEPRIEHTQLSQLLELNSRHQLEMIKNYLSDFESLGVMRFETAKPKQGSTGGRPETVALLNEDQCYLLVTYSRNSAIARQVKLKLIMAFRAVRDALVIRQEQYLPNYHRAHDVAHQVALNAAAQGSTTPESIHHINLEKLINKTFFIDAGSRSTLPPELQSAVSTSYVIAGNAMAETLNMGGDHKQAYQAVKQRLSELAQLLAPCNNRLGV